MRLALQPGVGLGPFILGAPLPDTLALLRQQAAVFACVEVRFAAGTAAAGPPAAGAGPPPDLALTLPGQGLHLVFDGAQQRLRLVDVYDPTRLQVTYGGHVFGGAASPPAFGRVCEALGPTYPGEPEGGQFPLQYPGVAFLFPLAQTAGGGGGRAAPLGMSSSIAGVEFPVGLSTPAARILVHHGAAASLEEARRAPPPPPPPGAPWAERVEAVPGQGLLLGGGALLRFGDSPQDVVTELGQPSCSRPAAGRAAALGGPAAAAAAGAAPPDYYLCYAARGLDVLFCGASHRAVKFVMHGNPPGHPDFGQYAKCLFRVHPPGSWALPSGCEDGDAGSSPHTYASASAGSEAGASMKTAASGNSLAALAAVEAPAAALLTLQPHGGEGSGGEPAGAAAAASRAAAEAEQCDGDGASQAQAAPAAALGRPPRPPTSLPIPTPPPGSSKGGASKKKKKKERLRAAAAARLAGGGSGGDPEESATDTDTSFADSAPSSLASSPGMNSFLASIAATGGVGGAAAQAAAAAAAAAAPRSACSSEAGSAADPLAGRERRLDNGSAFDGWSEADDLALLVGGEEAALASAPAGPAAGDQAQPAERQQQPGSKLRVCAGVQTAPAAEGELAAANLAAAAAAAADPESPDSFVMADSPALFDDSAAAAEYEAVPLQRSSGTQTQPHLLSGAAPLRGVVPRRGGGAAAAASASTAAVGVDARLPDIQAAFGAGAKPALHTRGRHPFGASHLYAYRGAVFEVLRSGAIATVTLFEP